MCRQRMITGGTERGEKNMFVPRSLVQGMMEGPTEEGIQQHCVKREREGGMGLNTSKHIKWSTCSKTTHTFGLLHV